MHSAKEKGNGAGNCYSAAYIYTTFIHRVYGRQKNKYQYNYSKHKAIYSTSIIGHLATNLS